MKTVLKPLFKIFVLSLFLFGVTPIQAKELVKILPMKNASRNVYFDLYIVVSENKEVVGLKMYDHEDHIWETYNINSLASGVPVKKEGRYDVIILKSDDFEQDRGGHFVIDFMRSGITGARGEIDIKFDFNGSQWHVYHRGSKVERLDFYLNSIFGKVVGIKKVTPVLKRR